MLTGDKRRVAEQLYPSAVKWAKRFNSDDEYQSVAQLALCEAVDDYRPGAVSVKTFAYRRVHLALLHYRWQVSRRREVSSDFSDFLSPDVSTLDLPDSLLEIARLYWLETLPLRTVAKRAGLTRRACRERLDRVIHYLRGTK